MLRLRKTLGYACTRCFTAIALQAIFGPGAAWASTTTSTSTSMAERRTRLAMTYGLFGMCACSRTGVLKCWAYNYDGRLGYGDTHDRGGDPNEMGDALPAVSLGTGRTCMDVAAGDRHFCALLDDASVKCWGYAVAGHGRLGYNDATSRGSASSQMGDNLPAVDLGDTCIPVQVSAATYHSCVICEDGTVKCWGRSPYSCQESDHGESPGTMGNNLPTLDFGAGKTVLALSVASEHTCAMLHDGTAKCCGRNSAGQLGYADTTDRYLSTQMGDNLPAIAFGAVTPQAITCANGYRTFVFFTDGTVKGVGRNLDYDLGYSDISPRTSWGDALPAIAVGSGLTAVSGGSGTFSAACIIFSDYQLKCYGENVYGYGDTAVRNGANPATMGDNLPFIDLGQGVVSVAMDENVACAVLVDNSIKCWGVSPGFGFGYGDKLARGTTPGTMGNALPTVDLGANFLSMWTTPTSMSAGSISSAMTSTTSSTRTSTSSTTRSSTTSSTKSSTTSTITSSTTSTATTDTTTSTSSTSTTTSSSNTSRTTSTATTSSTSTSLSSTSSTSTSSSSTSSTSSSSASSTSTNSSSTSSTSTSSSSTSSTSSSSASSTSTSSSSTSSTSTSSSSSTSSSRSSTSTASSSTSKASSSTSSSSSSSMTTSSSNSTSSSSTTSSTRSPTASTSTSSTTSRWRSTSISSITLTTTSSSSNTRSSTTLSSTATSSSSSTSTSSTSLTTTSSSSTRTTSSTSLTTTSSSSTRTTSSTRASSSSSTSTSSTSMTTTSSTSFSSTISTTSRTTISARTTASSTKTTSTGSSSSHSMTTSSSTTSTSSATTPSTITTINTSSSSTSFTSETSVTIGTLSATNTTTSTSTSTTSTTSASGFPTEQEFEPKQAYVSGSYTVTAACTTEEMRLGCQVGVAEIMLVNESQVGCLVMSKQAQLLRRLSLETYDWYLQYIIEVPSNDTAVLEHRIQTLSIANNSGEFASALNRSLLEVVNDTVALTESFRFRELGEVSIPDLGDELEVRMWVSYMLGKARCSKAAQVEDYRPTGHASATCFAQHEQVVDDGAALTVNRAGAYSIIVPSTIFEETGIAHYVLVVISLNNATAQRFQDGENGAVGAAVSIVLGGEEGLIHSVADLQRPINLTLEGLSPDCWECASWETAVGWSQSSGVAGAGLGASSLECAVPTTTIAMLHGAVRPSEFAELTSSTPQTGMTSMGATTAADRDTTSLAALETTTVMTDRDTTTLAALETTTVMTDDTDDKSLLLLLGSTTVSLLAIGSGVLCCYVKSRRRLQPSEILRADEGDSVLEVLDFEPESEPSDAKHSSKEHDHEDPLNAWGTHARGTQSPLNATGSTAAPSLLSAAIPVEAAVPQDNQSQVYKGLSAACDDLLNLPNLAGFQGSLHDIIKEKMLGLRRAWDHMLLRLTEVEDNVERLRMEKFMRDFLPPLRAGVRDQKSSDKLTQSIERLSGALAQELIRWNLMAMEPQKACRTLLHLPELRKIKEHELVAPKSQGDFLGKGMFAVHKGWWQPSSSSSSLGSDSFSRIPVAVKTYEARSSNENEEDDNEEGELEKLFDRVERNARRQMACAHNNVLRIFGECRGDTALMLIMPHISAGSLEAILQPGAKQTRVGEMLAGAHNLTRSIALADLFAGVSAALAHIHSFQEPVVHLDLKPANILVAFLPGGMLQPKLCDFDAARVVVQKGAGMPGTTSYHVAEGTYDYMSPERLRDSQSDTPAADIYAFAMVMTKCITGRLALANDGTNHTRVGNLDTNWVVRIYAGDRPELCAARDLETYETSIRECWHGKPEQRPASAAVAEEHLERLKKLRFPEGGFDGAGELRGGLRWAGSASEPGEVVEPPSDEVPLLFEDNPFAVPADV